MIVRHIIYRPGTLKIEMMEGRNLTVKLAEKAKIERAGKTGNGGGKKGAKTEHTQ